MSELREQIADFLEDISRPSETRLHADENLDYILALIAEAMLGDEAVEAGAATVIGYPVYDVDQAEARSTITAALSAAGITVAGQEGAGNE